MAKKKKKKSKGYSDIVSSILDVTPAFQPVADDFEAKYTPELQAEDLAQAEANVKPYFQEQITRELEDLNAFVNTENVNYDRSLRRARFSMATGGGAIGSERTSAEGEISSDHQKTINEKLRVAEQDVGTEQLTGAGYASQRQQKGDTIDKMSQAVNDWQQWFKQQRSDRYYADVNRMYAQESNDTLTGGKKKKKKKKTGNTTLAGLSNSSASLNPTYVNPIAVPV